MTFDKEYFNLGYLDMLSYKDTFIHRLDPRTKLLRNSFLHCHGGLISQVRGERALALSPFSCAALFTG